MFGDSLKLLAVMISCTLCLEALAQTPPPVLDVTDPDLRFWVSAEDLVTNEGLQDGDAVTQWIDRSSYGTIMAPRTNYFLGGPYLGDSVEEAPHLELADINGVLRPVVRFDAVGLEQEVGILERDRLYQTNNLDDPNTPEVEFDPVDIGNGEDLNLFVVYWPKWTLGEDPTTSIEFQIVVAKRGPDESVYEVGINTGNGRLINVQYDANVSYFSGSPISDSAQTWHVTSTKMLEGTQDTVEIWDSASESPTGAMQDLGVLNPVGDNGVIQNRNNTVPQPLGLGAHSQTCCGELESFEGKIAEVIIFARNLTTQEFADVDAYLHQKWFGADLDPDPDVDGDGDVDGDDLLLIQQNELPLIAPWQAQYGSVASAAPIPEPGSLAIATWMALMHLSLMRRRR